MSNNELFAKLIAKLEECCCNIDEKINMQDDKIDDWSQTSTGAPTGGNWNRRD